MGERLKFIGRGEARQERRPGDVPEHAGGEGRGRPRDQRQDGLDRRHHEGAGPGNGEASNAARNQERGAREERRGEARRGGPQSLQDLRGEAIAVGGPPS
eukprot:6415437-Pyramimonas_sp.AAC.1